MTKVTATPLGRFGLVASGFLLPVILIHPGLRKLAILLVQIVLALVSSLIILAFVVGVVVAIPLGLVLLSRYVVHGHILKPQRPK